MKRLSRCTLALVAVVLVSVCLPCFAFAGNEDFSYSVDYDGRVTITGYNGSDSIVKIPSAIDGRAVTGIGNRAFYRCAGITSIQIPSSVTELGYNVFGECTDLKSITLPSSIKEIGYYTFAKCPSLTSVVLSNGIAKIAAHMFEDCDALTGITLPGSLETIEPYAFSRCTDLPTVSLPSGLTSIGDHAFDGCTSLTNAALPDSVVEFGMCIFNNCTSLASITLPSTLKSVPFSLLGGCTAIKTVTLPNGVQEIGHYAFNGCTSLTGIAFPGSLTYIGSFAFNRCESLKSVTMPAAVDFIGPNAFRASYKLGRAFFQGDRPSTFGQFAFLNTATDFRVYYPVSRLSSWDGFAAYPSQAYSVVTVYPQNGSAAYKVTADVIDGHITAPAKPTWAEHVFGGWYKEAACKTPWYFTTAPITGDISVFAKWAVKQYMISVTASNASYGTVSGGASYAYGSTATAKATPKAGCRFVRWLEGSTAVSTGSSYSFKVTKTRALKAEFARVGTPVVNAASAGYNSIRLTWAAIPGATKYAVYRATASVGPYTWLTEVLSPGYIGAGLTTGRTYYYKVRAKCVAGSTTTYGGYSAIAPARPVPATPTGVKAARVSSTGIKLTWNAVLGATGYAVYRGASSAGPYTWLKETAAASFTNMGLTTGKTYCYKVRAYRLMGSAKVYGSFSAIVSARP